MTNKYLDQSIESLLSEDDYLISNSKPSEWAESRRIMGTEESNFAGPFKYDRTPYLREVVDCLDPSHPAREIAIMKGAQVGFSTGVIENGIGYIIEENPGNIILAARDADLVKDMVDKKIDPMIDSCGLRHLIRPNVVRARNQRTGDTSHGKEFAGGSLRTFSIQKPGRMRQVSAKYGLLDDFEAAPSDKHAGDAASLFRTRFKSFGDSKKIFWISTPEVKQTSNIEPLYLKGDQRKYFVPCPCCGDYITLEWRTTSKSGKKAGITWEVDENKDLISESVGYTCQSCEEFFTDGHKYEMNLAGEWRPTVKQKDPAFYSYHLSSLYAPPGMDNWEDAVRDYLEACPPGGRLNIDKYKTFINTWLGLTWEDRGQTPSVSRLALNTRQYEIGIIPNQLSEEDGNGEIVMLTCACDLNGKEDDARLDYEILAWSERGISYSVDHGSIGTFIPRENTLKKKVDRERWTYQHRAERNVWDKFLELITDQYEDQSGDLWAINIVGIDTGHHTDYANEFLDIANNYVMTVGLKGKGITNFRKIDANTSPYSKMKSRQDSYMVEVNQVKDELAGTLNLQWVEGDDVLQPNGFMNFPTPSENKYTMKSYFSHYQGEKKVMQTDKSGNETGYVWQKKNANVMNHYWDVRVYNLTVKEILVDKVCKEQDVKEPSWRAYCLIITG